jgi:hypothetical protein
MPPVENVPVGRLFRWIMPRNDHGDAKSITKKATNPNEYEASAGGDVTIAGKLSKAAEPFAAAVRCHYAGVTLAPAIRAILCFSFGSMASWPRRGRSASRGARGARSSAHGGSRRNNRRQFGSFGS